MNSCEQSVPTNQKGEVEFQAGEGVRRLSFALRMECFCSERLIQPLTVPG